MPTMPPFVIMAWILCSMTLGFMGKNTKLGSFGMFLASFFFSPVVGLLLLITSTPRSQGKN